MKTLAQLIVFSCLLHFGQAYAQTESKTATARIIESSSGVFSRIAFVNEKGEGQTIPLQRLKMMGGNLNDSIMMENQKTINKFINEKKAMGYEISHLSTSGENIMYTYIVFVRKE